MTQALHQSLNCPPPRILAPGLILVLALVGTILSSCTPTQKLSAPGGEENDSRHAPGRCEAFETVSPTFSPAQELQFPQSQLTVHAELSETFINRRLDEQLDRTLAQEKKRDVGAPGQAAYVVRRGPAQLEQQENHVQLTLPVDADISVCKPFGNTCFRYGSCQPKFLISLGLDTDLDKNFKLYAPRLSSKTREGCRIAIDVTPKLESIVRVELQKAQRELSARWPSTEDYAGKLALHQHDPISLWADTCAKWSNISIKQQVLKVSETQSSKGRTDRKLSAALELDGHLTPAGSCNQRGEETTEPLPRPESQNDIPEGSQLYFPELIAIDELKTAMVEFLSRSTALGEFTLEHLSPGADQRVYFSLQLRGEFCGTVWLSTHLHPNADGARLRLTQTRTEGSYSKKLTKTLGTLIEELEAKVGVELRGAVWLKNKGHELALDNVLAPIRTSLAAQSLELKVERLKSKAPQLVLGPQELVILYPVSARVRLQGQNK